MSATLSSAPFVPVFIVVMVALMLFWGAQNWFQRRSRPGRLASKLYGSIVTQARLPAIYGGGSGVPDTLEGRFGVIVLHVFLLADRLRREGPKGQALSQAVIEAFITDMDDNMREIGIGDLAVPKKIKVAAGVLYERMRVYGQAMQMPDDAALGGLLVGHLAPQRTEQGGELGLEMAAYMRDTRAMLDRQSFDDFGSGRVSFPAMPPLGEGS